MGFIGHEKRLCAALKSWLLQGKKTQNKQPPKTRDSMQLSCGSNFFVITNLYSLDSPVDFLQRNCLFFCFVPDQQTGTCEMVLLTPAFWVHAAIRGLISSLVGLVSCTRGLCSLPRFTSSLPSTVFHQSLAAKTSWDEIISDKGYEKVVVERKVQVQSTKYKSTNWNRMRTHQ